MLNKKVVQPHAAVASTSPGRNVVGKGPLAGFLRRGVVAEEAQIGRAFADVDGENVADCALAPDRGLSAQQLGDAAFRAAYLVRLTALHLAKHVVCRCV